MESLKSAVMWAQTMRKHSWRDCSQKKFLHHLVRVYQVYLREHMQNKKQVCSNENTGPCLFIEVRVLLDWVGN